MHACEARRGPNRDIRPGPVDSDAMPRHPVRHHAEVLWDEFREVKLSYPTPVSRSCGGMGGCITGLEAGTAVDHSRRATMYFGRLLSRVLAGAMVIFAVGAEAAGESSRIVLKPTQGKMTCTATTASARTGMSTDSKPEVWLCHRNLHELVDEGADWEFVKKHLDGIKVYIGALARGRSHILTDDELTRLVKMLNETGLKLSIECGGTMGQLPVDENNGRKSAEIALRAVRKVHEAGGTVHFLDMDGPVRRLLATGSHRSDFGKRYEWQGFTEIQPCADQLMIFMAVVRQEYPAIQCFALTNFPNWGFKGGLSYHGRYENRQDWGDYFDVVSTIVPRAKAEKLPLVAVTVDNPYDYAIGERFSVTLKDPGQVNWMQRMIDLERYV